MVIGKILRQFRQAKGWSLAELSKHSGVALSTLSRIETARMTGTLESHVKIAQALGVRLAEFYAALDPGPALELLRNEEASRVSYSGREAHVHLLSRSSLQKQMLPVKLQLPPHKSTSRERSPEGTEKFVYVLKGLLEVSVGEETVRLKPGDSLYVRASLPHGFANPGAAPVLALCVSAPPSL